MSNRKSVRHPKDKIKSRNWAIAPLASVGISPLVGVSMSIYDLVNRQTHRSHKLVVKAAILGWSMHGGKLDSYKDLIAAGAGQLVDADYTNFRTERDANFDTFDAGEGNITTLSGILYSVVWLRLYTSFMSLLASVNMNGFGLSWPGADTGQILSTEIIYGNGRALGAPDLLVGDIVPRLVEETSIRSYATENDDSILLVFPAKLLFEFNDFRLRDEAAPLLRNLAAYIRSKPALAYPRIYIVGHTDSLGSGAYNDILSSKRAARVHDYLQVAIPGQEFFERTWVPLGRGKKSPIAPNRANGADYPEGRSLNRRVEVLLLSPGAPIPKM